MLVGNRKVIVLVRNGVVVVGSKIVPTVGGGTMVVSY